MPRHPDPPLVPPRRVLVYGMNFAPEFTGVGRYTGELALALAAMGWSITAIVTPPHYPGWRVPAPYRNLYRTEDVGGIEVIRCPLYLARDMRGLARLLAPLSFALSSLPVALWRLLRHRPDVLLCIEPTLFSAPVAAALARLLGVRTILHVQDLEIDGAFEVGHLKNGMVRRAALMFERVTLRLFDRVVTISETMRAALIAKGVPAARTSVIRNWVDLGAIAPIGTRAYREVVGILPSAFVALYSGNIGAKQGLDMMLDAAERLSGRTDVLFVIAGEGPEKARLQARYGHLGTVRFLGFQPEAALSAFLDMADVHVVPQLATTADFALPSKLGPILASGRRVIVATRADQELARFLGSAATQIAPGDDAALADAVLALVQASTDDHRADRLALAATLSKDTAIAHFAQELAGPAALPPELLSAGRA